MLNLPVLCVQFEKATSIVIRRGPSRCVHPCLHRLSFRWLARTHHHRPRIESQPTGSGIHYVTLSPASDDDIDIGKRNDDGPRCTDCTQPTGCEEQIKLACSQIMLGESVRKSRRLALMSVTMPRGLGVSAPHSLPNEASSSAINRHAMTLAML